MYKVTIRQEKDEKMNIVSFSFNKMNEALAFVDICVAVSDKDTTISIYEAEDER